MDQAPKKTTVETSLKAEFMGIGGGVKVSREYAGNSPVNRPLGEMILEFFRGRPAPGPARDVREDDLLKSLEERAKKFIVPNIDQYQVDGYWASLQLQPTVTAIVSGKGGVGKSTIALGLTEAFSRDENVLLIDFDLHNRGLTSKYRGLEPGMSSVLSELKRFRESIVKSPDLRRDGSNLVLSSITSDVFHKLRREFCHPETEAKLSPLGLVPLYQESVLSGDDNWPDRQRPRNCYFLPSRLPGSTFLGTPESRLDAAEVALFLTFLAHRARQCEETINRIVVDCHGAHDMFMVGAILASDQVVVVSKPEESAFEGTIELMRFAQSAVEAKNVFPRAQTLVFNELHPEDRSVAELLFRLYYGNPGKLRFDDIPFIPATDVVRDELKFYDRPALLGNSSLGPAILKIAKAGERVKRKEFSPSASAAPLTLAADRPAPADDAPSTTRVSSSETNGAGDLTQKIE